MLFKDTMNSINRARSFSSVLDFTELHGSLGSNTANTRVERKYPLGSEVMKEQLVQSLPEEEQNRLVLENVEVEVCTFDFFER